MRLGNFSAHVVVDGSELKEYEVTVNSSGTQAICWIASETGKKFSVKWKRHSATPKHLDSKGVLTVDGKRCDTFIFAKDSSSDSITFSAIFLGDAKERELMFCNLQLTDNEILVGKLASSHLGDITLRVAGGIMGQESRESEESEDEDTPATDVGLTSDTNIYHEKTVKKLTTHCVGFGPERENSDYELVKFAHNRDPPLKFVFKYRPIEILQANGIAPRPTPALSVPTALSDHPSGAQTETPSAVLEKIALLENELKRLRSQVLGEVEDQKPKRIKREHIEEHPVVHGEVIDLT